MPKILITGNGFDLNYGLPTLYNDFMEVLSYIEKNDKIDFHSIYSLCSTYDNINANYNEFELNLESIDKLRVQLEDNLWYNFFKKEFAIETWIDFEQKIEWVLNQFFIYFELMQEWFFEFGPTRRTSININKEILNKSIELSETLKSFEILNEMNSNFNLNKQFIRRKHNYAIRVDESAIIDKLLSDLYKFENIFSLYLKTFIFPLYKEIKYSLNNHLLNVIDNHFTFNYTPTFNELSGNNIITKYLHGRVTGESSNIVFGISEVPKNNISAKLSIRFTKYYQKINKETDYKFLNEYQGLDSEPYLYIIFGHSLDKSDEDYVKEVFDLVNRNKNEATQMVVVYHNDKSKSQLQENILLILGKENVLHLMRNDKLVFVQSNTKEFNEKISIDLQKFELHKSAQL